MELIPKVNVPEGVSGEWRVERFEIDDKPSLHKIRLAMMGRGVEPGWYTRLKRGNEIVMSDTPAEMNDHREFVWKAHGHCLINGLGLGMCIGAILQKPEVTRVTVIEKSEDVIRLVAPSYTDERVEIIHADAFDYKPPKGIRYGAVWHDIWDSISSENLPEMYKLHRKYGKITDWQGSWARWQCCQERRQYG